MSRVGRPREHDEETRAVLRAVAERLVTEGGPAAFSVRAVADEADTTTRAVYSLFGSKEGLLVETDDPVADLIAVGVPVFRRLILEHPARYRIAFQRVVPGLRPGPELTAARERAWSQLQAKVQRLDDAGLLGDKSVREAAVEFNAMLEGLANAELRGAVFRNLPEGDEERAWRNALTTVIDGFSLSPPRRQRQDSR
jgi:AcrR family transcriptional regulator